MQIASATARFLPSPTYALHQILPAEAASVGTFMLGWEA